MEKLFPHDQFQSITCCEGREEMDIFWIKVAESYLFPAPPCFIENEPGAPGNNQNSGWLPRAPAFKLSVISLHSAAHCVSDSCGLILPWEVCSQPPPHPLSMSAVEDGGLSLQLLTSRWAALQPQWEGKCWVGSGFGTSRLIMVSGW